MPARRTSQDAGGRRQSSPAARLAEITRGGRDHRTRAEGRRGGDFAIMADARRADGRRRDRERGGRERGVWGRGCPPAARPRDGCGGTAAGPSRWDEERPVRRLRGRSSPPRSRLRGRGQARGGGQSPADEAAVGTAAADVAADKAAGARGGGETARRGRHNREERRLRGQGRGTAVQDVPAHEAAAAGEERGEGGGRAPPHASPRDSRGRDIALRGRMPRGRSWGMSPRRRERGAGSRGGSGGPPAAARGRGRGRTPADEVAGGVRRRRRGGWRGGGETAHRGVGRICGREICAFADKAAESPCVTSPRRRSRQRGRRGRAPPDARPRDSRRSGRCLWERRPRERSRGTLPRRRSRARGSRKGAGAAGRGSCCGRGGGETSPVADKARARPPRQLPRPDLAASIARRGGAGPQPLPQPSSGPKWCRGGVSSWSRVGLKK